MKSYLKSLLLTSAITSVSFLGFGQTKTYVERVKLDNGCEATIEKKKSYSKPTKTNDEWYSNLTQEERNYYDSLYVVRNTKWVSTDTLSVDCPNPDYVEYTQPQIVVDADTPQTDTVPTLMVQTPTSADTSADTPIVVYNTPAPENCDTTILMKQPGPRFYSNIAGGPISVTPSGGNSIPGTHLYGDIGVSVPLSKTFSWDTDVWAQYRNLKQTLSDTVLVQVNREDEDEYVDVLRDRLKNHQDISFGIKTGPVVHVWKDNKGAGSVQFHPFVGAFTQINLNKTSAVSMYDDVPVPYNLRFDDGPRVGYNYGVEVRGQLPFNWAVKPVVSVGVEKRHLFGTSSTTAYVPFNATEPTLMNPDPLKNTMNLYAKVGFGIGGSTTKREPEVVQPRPSDYEILEQQKQQNKADTTQAINAVDTSANVKVNYEYVDTTSSNKELIFLPFEIQPETPHVPVSEQKISVKPIGHKPKNKPNIFEKIGDFVDNQVGIVRDKLNTRGQSAGTWASNRRSPYDCPRI